MKSLGKTLWQYALAIIVPLAVGGAAAALTADSMEMYESMTQPPLSPPGWLFPVVWTILYGLMGWSSRLIADSTDPRRRRALLLYMIQLFVNFWWPVMFFWFQAPLAALVILLALLVLVIWMVRSFRKIDPLAADLNVPYILWLIFALWLNAAFWWLNR